MAFNRNKKKYLTIEKYYDACLYVMVMKKSPLFSNADNSSAAEVEKRVKKNAAIESSHTWALNERHC